MKTAFTALATILLTVGLAHAQASGAAQPDEAAARLLIANELTRQLADTLDVFKLRKWEIVNPHVTWLSEGSAIVNYAWTGAGTLFDQPVPPLQSAVT